MSIVACHYLLGFSCACPDGTHAFEAASCVASLLIARTRPCRCCTAYLAQKEHAEPSSDTQPAEEEQGRYKYRSNSMHQNNRLRPLRRTRASALEQRSGRTAIPCVDATIVSALPMHHALRTSASCFRVATALSAGACRSLVRVARNKELARRRAVEDAGLNRFGALQQAGFDTMIRRPIARAVRSRSVKMNTRTEKV